MVRNPGTFTRALAYWRRVMTDTFNLIEQMTQAIKSLYQSLCASDAHNVYLEAQNTTLVEQGQVCGVRGARATGRPR